MNIKEMLDLQRQQQSFWYDVKQLSDSQKSEWMDELLLGLYEEVGELARASRSKTHILPERVPEGNVVEELVDVFKYALAIADLHSIDSGTIVDRFKTKTKTIQQRFKQRVLNMNNIRVLVTDLDGCVADIEPFIEKFGAYGKSPSGVEVEKAKSRWYESGGFLDLPAIDGAREVLEEAKANGVHIAIITARPAWEHRRVRSDTVAWLEANKIPYDILAFDKDKYDSLVKHVLPAKVLAFIEDRDKHAIELAAQGITVKLIDKSYNRTLADHDCIERVYDWDGIRQQMQKGGWQ